MSDNIVPLLFGLVFVVLGAAFIYYGIWVRKTSAASLTWPSVDGSITRSQVQSFKGKGGRKYVPDMRFTYQVNGTAYEGKKISWESPVDRSPPSIEAFIAPYPVGQAVKVFYDPAKPSRSVLKPVLIGKMHLIMFLIIGAIFLSAGLLFLLITAR